MGYCHATTTTTTTANRVISFVVLAIHFATFITVYNVICFIYILCLNICHLITATLLKSEYMQEKML